MPRISLIVAKSDNNVIGRNNQLPWHLPEDLAHFKRTTSGHPILMGRKTYESIGRPLPNRRNLVMTTQTGWNALGIESVASFDEAIQLCQENDEIFVIGGSQIYALALAYATRVIATELHRHYEGDAFFPTLPSDFKEVERRPNTSEQDPSLPFDIVIYERDQAQIKA